MNTKHLILQLASGKALVLFDQAIVSGGNFTLGVLLARLLGLEVFGTYSLLWMGVLFALSLHQAYMTQPMLSLFAGKNADEQPRYLRQLSKLQFIISAVITVIALLVFGALKMANAGEEWLGYLPLTGALTAVYLFQDFLRKIFFLKKQYHPPLLLDLALYIPLLTALPLLHLAGRLDLPTALWAMLGAYGLSAGMSTFFFRMNQGNLQNQNPAEHPGFWDSMSAAIRRQSRPSATSRPGINIKPKTQDETTQTGKNLAPLSSPPFQGRAERDLPNNPKLKKSTPFSLQNLLDSNLSKTAKEHYHFSIWLLGTSLLQWFSGNFFLIAAAGVLGTVAVGALRMAQNMVGLCHVIFLAMENIVPVEAAQHFFKHGQTQMFAYLRRVTIVTSIPVILMLGALTAAAPWLIRWLYGTEYLPYSYLVGVYALLYVFVFTGYPLRFALRTLQFTSPIFIAYCLSSGVSLLVAFPMARAWGLNGILAGLWGTQVLTLAVYVFFLWKKRQPAGGSPAVFSPELASGGQPLVRQSGSPELASGGRNVPLSSPSGDLQHHEDSDLPAENMFTNNHFRLWTLFTSRPGGTHVQSPKSFNADL